MREARLTTGSLAEFGYRPRSAEVLSPGTMTTVQDADGRRGYWHVGVPPSGAFDRRSFRLGNRLLGNDADAAGPRDHRLRARACASMSTRAWSLPVPQSA